MRKYNPFHVLKFDNMLTLSYDQVMEDESVFNSLLHNISSTFPQCRYRIYLNHTRANTTKSEPCASCMDPSYKHPAQKSNKVWFLITKC